MKAEAYVPYKFPSFNKYIDANRSYRYGGNNMKRQVQDDISWYLRSLPEFNKPVQIHFHWIEGDARRDWDNVMYAKKFIQDALVELGKIKNDNRKWLPKISDTAEQGKEFGVIITISEVEG